MLTPDQATGDLVVSGFDQGIADSPYSGISDMRNITIDSVTGEADLNFKTVNNTPAQVTWSIASASGTTITYTTSGADPYYGQAVYLTGASLPTGLTAGTADAGPYYWVGNLNTTAKTLELYAKPFFVAYNISAVNTTATGTGTSNPIPFGTPKYWSYSVVSSSDLMYYYFLIDSNGRAWANDGGIGDNWLFLGNQTGTAQAGAFGNGIVWYTGQNPPAPFNTGASGYLFVMRNRHIDYLEVLGGNWTYGWKTLATTYSIQKFDHYALVGQDNAVYICDSHSITSIVQTDPNTAFDPATSSTYTFNQPALNLPTQDNAVFLAELGQSLLIGGSKEFIYPWDRTSTSYDLPILVGDPYIARMVTVNANTYIFAGTRGRIYITNGSQANLFAKIPDHLSGTVSPYMQWGAWGSTRNHLYFGINGYNNAGTAISGYGGLWKIDLENGALTCANTLSYDTTGANNGYTSLFIPWPTIQQTMEPGGGFYAGYATASGVGGIDQSSTDVYDSTSAPAYVISDLIPVGTKYKPITPNNPFEFKLATPLKANESVSVYCASFFSTSSSDYTQNTSLTGQTSTQGSSTETILSDMYSWPISVLQWLSVKVVLTGYNPASGSPSYNRLTEMRIHGITQQITSWRQLQ